MFSANSSQVSDDKLFVEDVMSCFLYTGNSSTQTITNGIDLAGKGGLVWVKQRNAAASHRLYDTSRGASQMLASNTTSAQSNTSGYGVTNFGSSGFTLVDDASNYGVNVSGNTYASWTFRKAPKFFDVVTYTGDNVSGRAIPHNLGIAPGCIIVKRTSGVEDWWVYHRSGISIGTGRLNLTDGFGSASPTGLFTSAPTATEFYVSADAGVNASGSTYVAYLFAHDTTSDGIIQCGSYTGNGSATGPSVTLGWEPQWVLVKNATTGYDWWMLDNMRGFTAPSANDAYLVPNSSQAEAATQDIMSPTATGFQLATSGPMFNRSGDTFIYIAIRRGPMRIPTSGTSVFKPDYMWGTSSSIQGYLGAPADLNFAGYLTGSANNARVRSRLVGSNFMATSSSSAETADGGNYWDNMLGFSQTNGSINTSLIEYTFRRAPSFLDVVCYTGGGSTTSVYNHNLGVVPELIIIKSRSNGTNVNWWPVKMKSVLGQKALALNSTNPDPLSSSTYWASADDTATQFRTRASATAYDVNATGYTYVAYLFASCPGVSKVGSYTGNGSSQTIDCGFAAGARFVMIKRTDSTGNWLVADSARGIVAGNDPLLYLNSTAAEVTSLDWIDADSSGFVVNQDSTANANVNGATYIYLAIS